MSANTIAFDTETKGLAWYKPDNEVFLITWADADGEYMADATQPTEVAAFMDAIKKADVIVAHNMPFDVHQIRATFDFDILTLDAEFHDTDIMARLAMPAGQTRPSYKLKDLAQTYLRDDAKEGDDEIQKIAKKMKMRLKDQPGVPATPAAYYHVWRAYPEVMEKYALLDARLTYDLHEMLLDYTGIKDNSVWEMEQKVQPILIEAERHGIRLDKDVVQEIKAEYEGIKNTHQRRLVTELPEQALGGEGSEDALIDAFLAMGVPLTARTEKSGKYSVAKWALEPFVDEYPIIDSYLGFETARKFLSTFIAPMDGETYVHTNFGQCQAWTGRMSSWRPNLQNLPARAESATPIRSMFVPRDGYQFAVMDFDSIEIRIFAHYSNVPEFQKDIEEGRDINAWMAANIANDGRTEDDFKKGTAGESERALAKRTTYGTLYGLGGKGLTTKEPGRFDPGPFLSTTDKKIIAARAAGREWPKPGYQYQEAKDFLKKIKQSLPGYYKLNKRIKDTIMSRGYLWTLFGRKQVVGKDKAYVGMNALIQGTAADIMKLALISADEKLKPMGARILLIVHDEIVAEVPDGTAIECGEVLRQAMEDATDLLKPPLKVSGSVVSTNYADAK